MLVSQLVPVQIVAILLYLLSPDLLNIVMQLIIAYHLIINLHINQNSTIRCLEVTQANFDTSVAQSSI